MNMVSISNIPMDYIQDFSPNKPRTVIFTSGDDSEAKQLVIELINSTGFVSIDLGSLVKGGAMHENLSVQPLRFEGSFCNNVVTKHSFAP